MFVDYGTPRPLQVNVRLLLENWKKDLIDVEKVKEKERSKGEVLKCDLQRRSKTRTVRMHEFVIFVVCVLFQHYA